MVCNLVLMSRLREWETQHRLEKRGFCAIGVSSMTGRVANANYVDIVDDVMCLSI